MVEDGVLEWRGVWSGIFPAYSVPYQQHVENNKYFSYFCRISPFKDLFIT